MNECGHGRPEEAEACATALRAALAAHGITLPSLGVDAVTFAGRRTDALVALGNCNAETGWRLVDVLRAASGEEQSR